MQFFFAAQGAREASQCTYTLSRYFGRRLYILLFFRIVRYLSRVCGQRAVAWNFLMPGVHERCVSEHGRYPPRPKIAAPRGIRRRWFDPIRLYEVGQRQSDVFSSKLFFSAKRWRAENCFNTSRSKLNHGTVCVEHPQYVRLQPSTFVVTMSSLNSQAFRDAHFLAESLPQKPSREMRWVGECWPRRPQPLETLVSDEIFTTLAVMSQFRTLLVYLVRFFDLTIAVSILFGSSS